MSLLKKQISSFLQQRSKNKDTKLFKTDLNGLDLTTTFTRQQNLVDITEEMKSLKRWDVVRVTSYRMYNMDILNLSDLIRSAGKTKEK